MLIFTAHPEILAYALDSAILDGTGAVSENLKGQLLLVHNHLKTRIFP